MTIYKIQPDVLRSIVFGAEMDTEDKISVLKWLQDSGKKLDILQAIKDNHAFKLNLHHIKKDM